MWKAALSCCVLWIPEISAIVFTHQVHPAEPAVYIGTNSEYGSYVELGTGIDYPGGRQTPWVYQDAKGQWHLTHGQRAKPYLKPAVADHVQQYKGIIEGEMRG